MCTMDTSNANYIKRSTCLKGRSSINNGTWQHNVNWEHDEVLVLIKCKHAKYAKEKKIIDPRACKIPTTQWWSQDYERASKQDQYVVST
jgi:hypothetical protein